VTYVIEFDATEAPTRSDGTVWTTLHLEQAAPTADLSLTASWTEIDTIAWTDTDASNAEPTSVTTANATLTEAWYRAWWSDADGGSSGTTAPVYIAANATATRFASLADMRARLGLSELDAVAAARCGLLLDLATAGIVAAVDKDDEWAAEQAPVPNALRALCIEIVARVMANPSGARSASEQLGAYQHTESYADTGHSLELTDREVLRARQAVWGKTSDSAQATSVLDDIAEVVPVLDDLGSWIA
jgi:hypothetical protein